MSAVFLIYTAGCRLTSHVRGARGCRLGYRVLFRVEFYCLRDLVSLFRDGLS